MKKEKGFTLIELMLVVAIIAVLAAAIVPRIKNIKGADRNTNERIKEVIKKEVKKVDSKLRESETLFKCEDNSAIVTNCIYTIDKEYRIPFKCIKSYNGYDCTMINTN